MNSFKNCSVCLFMLDGNFCSIFRSCHKTLIQSGAIQFKCKLQFD